MKMTERKAIYGVTAAMVLAVLGGMLACIQIGTEIYCQAVAYGDRQKEKHNAWRWEQGVGISIEISDSTNWIVRDNYMISAITNGIYIDDRVYKK